MKIVTRIAPSPTGQMHIGTVRTALFNYVFAKRFGGTFFVRIEDTDKERNKEEWVDAIWRDFEWCGIVPDMKYVQSEHLDRHRELLRGLVESGKAFESEEPAKDDPTRTVRVIRLRNPGVTVTFEDLIRGTVTFDTTELGDFVIARSIDDPLYHFAVVVDDGDAGVTHVIRAEEHISNTPRQILIQEALGLPRPQYAHIPLILAPDRSKLSKRKHSASIDRYRADGYLPEALINYLALLGWTPPSGKEILSLAEIIESFDLTDIHKGGAIFDLEKLKWFNRQYMLAMRDDDFASEALRRLREALAARGIEWNESVALALIPVLRERVAIWSDIDTTVQNGEFDFFFKDPELSAEQIPQKGSDEATAARHLAHLGDVCVHLFEKDFSDPEMIKAQIWEYAEQEGRGNVLWPLRFSLSGRAKSPDPFTIMSVIGKEASVRRIIRATQLLRHD